MSRVIKYRLWLPDEPWGPAYLYPDLECGRPGHVKYGAIPESAKRMGATVPIVHGPGCGSDSLVVEMTLNGEPILLGGKVTEGILEQFTGLVDPKGQDIYEGDIVWYGASHAVVQWKGCGFACSGLGHYCTDPERPLVSECTVIGNIRENSERLTQP